MDRRYQRLLLRGSQLSFLRRYFEANPDADEVQVETAINKLSGIEHAQMGVISLADDLDVETVAEIFVRINAKGVPLSSADFLMSKIVTYGDEGRNLRKLIDYFCPKNYLIKNGFPKQGDYNQIVNFALTETPINPPNSSRRR